MGLLNRPREKLIQSYRDNLQIVIAEEPLAIRFEQVQRIYFKPEKYQFVAIEEIFDERNFSEYYNISIEAHQSDNRSLSFLAHHHKPEFSINCYKEQIDTIIQRNVPFTLDLTLPPTKYVFRQGDIVSIQNVRLSRDVDIRELSAVGKVVELISTSNVQTRIIDLTHFNIADKRFSFQSLQNDPKSTLFGQNTIARTNAVRVARVKPPDPPPNLHKVDLQERLRLLLTPPIHEILSDPQLALPEMPFPYQTYGIKWLYDRPNGLLADEMGLGKTMQAIIAARLLWRDGLVKQILIVCPKSLIANWRKELSTWWPGIEWFTKVVGQDRQWFLRLAIKDATVKIINYESLQRELDWLKEKPLHHDLVIIDEAQRIKNPKSKSSQAVKELKSVRRWALTGTPIENSIEDFVSIFGFIIPSLIKQNEGVERIRTAIKPYFLRRRQEDVLKDLPDKIEQDIEIELGDSQRTSYDRAERDGVVELNDRGDTITVTHVFVLINKLRQICNFDQVTGESAKASLLIEELDDIVASGRKAIIFGQFVDERYGIKRLAKFMIESETIKKDTKILQYHGEIPSQQREGILDIFQKNPNYQILLMNYATGGVGLNLQAANYVFLFDRWWNPAVEDQAIKRCHRLGQKQAVFAKRFYCKGTIEERILKKLEEKRRLFTRVIDEERPTAASFGLNEEEVFSLFDLIVRPKRTNKPTAPTQLVLNNIDFKEFENLVALIYEKDGYQVRVTGRSHDGGVDIVAEKLNTGGLDRIIVQCKHQKQNVGRPVLQQLWGVLSSDHSITRCDFVTSGGFTAEAIDFATGKRLTLIDRSKLEELAKLHKVAQFVSL